MGGGWGGGWEERQRGCKVGVGECVGAGLGGGIAVNAEEEIGIEEEAVEGEVEAGGEGVAWLAAGWRGAHPRRGHPISRVAAAGPAFSAAPDQGTCACASVVISTGGLALPQIGATPFGYKVAEQFGLAIVPPRPALVPLALAPEVLGPRKGLAGDAIDAVAGCASHASFPERALGPPPSPSGPALPPAACACRRRGGPRVAMHG